MRSPPLLLLLITTQCCLLSIAAGDATVERVDHGPRLRFIREVELVAIPTTDEKAALSDSGLKAKIDEWEKRKTGHKDEVDRLKREKKTKMGEWRSANETVTEKTQAWTLVSKEYAVKSAPWANLSSEIEQLKREEIAAAKVVKFAKINVVDLPTDVDDERGWCVEELKITGDQMHELNDTLIPALERNLTSAGALLLPLEQAASDASAIMGKNECPPEASAGESELCPRLREDLQQAQAAVSAPDERFQSIATELRVAREDLARLAVVAGALVKLESALGAAAAASSAKANAIRRSNAIPHDVKSLEVQESTARKAKEAAEALVLTIASSVRNLDEALADEETRVAQDVYVLEVYYNEVAKRTPSTTTEIFTSTTTAAAAGFPVTYAIVVVVVALLIIVGIAVVVVRRRRKKRMEKSKEPGMPPEEESATFRPLEGDAKKRMTISEEDFESATIVRPRYDDDLPHDKGTEEMEKTPTSYKFCKNRMKFYSYGPPGEPELLTWREPLEEDTLAAFSTCFFQPAIFTDTDEPKLAKHMERQADRAVFPLPQEFVLMVETFVKCTGEDAVVPKLKFLTMRPEFLQYLHAMAGKAYDGTIKTRFPIKFFHVLWILLNVKLVLKRSYTSHLHEQEGSVVIAGATCGRFLDLLRMFGQRASEEKPGWLTHNYLFLGEYITKEAESPYALEAVLFLLLLKLLYPDHINLIRGKTDCHKGMNKHFTEGHLRARFGQRMAYILHNGLVEVFSYLPTAAVLNNNVFCSYRGFGKTFIQKPNAKPNAKPIAVAGKEVIAGKEATGGVEKRKEAGKDEKEEEKKGKEEKKEDKEGEKKNKEEKKEEKEEEKKGKEEKKEEREGEKKGKEEKKEEKDEEKKGKEEKEGEKKGKEEKKEEKEGEKKGKESEKEEKEEEKKGKESENEEKEESDEEKDEEKGGKKEKDGKKEKKERKNKKKKKGRKVKKTSKQRKGKKFNVERKRENVQNMKIFREFFTKIPFPLDENLNENVRKIDSNPTTRGVFKGILKEGFQRLKAEDYQEFRKMHGMKCVFKGFYRKKPNGFFFPFDDSCIALCSVPEAKPGYRGATIDIDIYGNMGVSVSALYHQFSEKDNGLDVFKKYHPRNLGMDEGAVQDKSKEELSEESARSIEDNLLKDMLDKKAAARKAAEDAEKKRLEAKAKEEREYQEQLALEAKWMKEAEEEQRKKAAELAQKAEEAKLMTADKEQPTKPSETEDWTQELSVNLNLSKEKKPAKVKPNKTEEVIAKIPDEVPKSEKKPAAAAKGKSAKGNSKKSVADGKGKSAKGNSSAKKSADEAKGVSTKGDMSAKSETGQQPPPVADAKGNTGAAAPVAAPPAKTGK